MGLRSLEEVDDRKGDFCRPREGWASEKMAKSIGRQTCLMNPRSVNILRGFGEVAARKGDFFLSWEGLVPFTPETMVRWMEEVFSTGGETLMVGTVGKETIWF